MGNKQQIAGDVASFCEALDRRLRLVDLFAGVGAGAGAAASSRRAGGVNDIQLYAQLAARCLITSREDPPDVERARQLLLPAYRSNLSKLGERYGRELSAERKVLRRRDADGLRRL